MKTVIMAGGKGTRIASVASDIPKAMIPVCGKPILEHQIGVLKKNGFTDIIIVTGHLGRHIKNYFGDGRSFGCNISYFSEIQPLGTAGSLYKLEELAEDFILLNGDIIFDADLQRMAAFHKNKKAAATLAVHPNNHPFDSALIFCDAGGVVRKWLNKEDERSYYKNLVNSGLHIISPELLRLCPQAKEKVDLDRDILKPFIPSGKIFAYITPEYIKDMGTPDRYAQVCSDIEKGIVAGKNLKVKQKAVFLDRDGTINKLKGFIKKPDDFELIEDVAQAIKKINSLGFLAVVITNQPVIARGEADFETLDLIHRKMETELGKEGAYVDDIYFCPHHPDRGFPGENAQYKTDCPCRKPKPGMILAAAEKYNIDISKSYMAGDDKRDVQAGINAGCTSVFLSDKSEEAENIKENCPQENVLFYPSLNEFADFLLEQEGGAGAPGANENRY
ncbi:MAG: HAD-IIIA family hydrolase [Spirochaetes bacterium]|nr:HAD-IIIA family hydrolase [Spirochaetota bacterium]